MMLCFMTALVSRELSSVLTLECPTSTLLCSRRDETSFVYINHLTRPKTISRRSVCGVTKSREWARSLCYCCDGDIQLACNAHQHRQGSCWTCRRASWGGKVSSTSELVMKMNECLLAEICSNPETLGSTLSSVEIPPSNLSPNRVSTCWLEASRFPRSFPCRPHTSSSSRTRCSEPLSKLCR